MVFTTEATRTGTSPDIEVYNTFVRQEAARNPEITGTNTGVNWNAVVSTDTIAASVNAFVDAPVYTVRKDTFPFVDEPDFTGVRIADGFGDFWDPVNVEPHQDAISFDQFGDLPPGTVQVFTGTNPDGSASPFPAGGNGVSVGRYNTRTVEWVALTEDDVRLASNPAHFYALSQRLIVPLSATFSLKVTGCVGTPAICSGLGDSGTVDLDFNPNNWDLSNFATSSIGESATFDAPSDGLAVSIRHTSLGEISAQSAAGGVEHVADNRIANVDFFNSSSPLADGGPGNPVHGGTTRLTVTGDQIDSSYTFSSFVVNNISDNADVAEVLLLLFAQLGGGSIGPGNVNFDPLASPNIEGLNTSLMPDVSLELFVFGSAGQATIFGNLVPIPEPSSRALLLLGLIMAAIRYRSCLR